jgi:2,4-dienoyl-CoA reductase-like NADH-dependent reductase (Old Yellow Enzyme family)
MHKKESTIKREAFFVEFADRIRPSLKSAKLAVTGGFRSKAAMNQALADKSCDICGLGRPLTAEPYFGAALIAAETERAKENLIPEAIQTGSSIMQIKEIATGTAIRDLSDKAVSDATLALMMAK